MERETGAREGPKIFAIKVGPVLAARLVTKGDQRVEVAAVMFAGQG